MGLVEPRSTRCGHGISVSHSIIDEGSRAQWAGSGKQQIRPCDIRHGAEHSKERAFGQVPKAAWRDASKAVEAQENDE